MQHKQVTRVRATDERFQSLLARHRAFWERAETNSFIRAVELFAASAPVRLPRSDGTFVSQAERLQPDMIDPSLLIDEVENWDPEGLDETLPAQGQYLVAAGLGDLMPWSGALRKIPWVEAMLGCPVKMTEGQIWNEHYEGDPEEVIRRGISFEQNPWFQLYMDFLRQLQSRLGTRFPVAAISLLRGTSDLVAAVMGVQEACVGWIDRPRFMARLLRVCTDAVLTVVEGAYKVLKPFQEGYPSAHALWTPAPVVRTQADHSILLSAKMYGTHILPFDLEVIRSCPMSEFHLHNCGLHLAPLLVEIPELNAIQVGVDPYPTKERKPYEVEMMQLILQHKPLILEANFPSLAESEWLLSQLPKRGLYFNSWFVPEVYEALPASLPGSEVWLLV